jgi:hypothetical protein
MIGIVCAFVTPVQCTVTSLPEVLVVAAFPPHVAVLVKVTGALNLKTTS